MFSAEPLVFLVCTSSDASVSLMTAAALSPKKGKPPPGVAVARETVVFCADAVVMEESVTVARTAREATCEVTREVRIDVISRLNFTVRPAFVRYRGRSLCHR